LIRQWAIQSLDRNQYFSKGGDSGACIWSLDGRVAGMLDGGSGGQNGIHDLTYATPMASILEHIRLHGGYSSATLV